MARAGKKKKERKERQADADAAPSRGSGEAPPGAGTEGWGDWGDETSGGRGDADAKEALPEVVDEVPRDDRPKTECEKNASKLRKKLREIERIEERLAKGDNVDPLQLPKIQKKAEVEQELQEEEQRQERERRRLEVQRREEERLQALRDEQAAREQRDREARERSAREAAEAEAGRRQRSAAKAPPG